MSVIYKVTAKPWQLKRIGFFNLEHGSGRAVSGGRLLFVSAAGLSPGTAYCRYAAAAFW